MDLPIPVLPMDWSLLTLSGKSESSTSSVPRTWRTLPSYHDPKGTTCPSGIWRDIGLVSFLPSFLPPPVHHVSEDIESCVPLVLKNDGTCPLI